MTLFANSGVAWPNYEAETRTAGTQTLAAGAGLLRIFAAIEEHRAFELEGEREQCVGALTDAARTYTAVAKQLSGEAIEGLSPSELELAALPRYRYYNGDTFLDLFVGQSRIAIAQLYAELANRAGRLASAVRVLEPRNEASDLAAQVFQMMNLWESMMIIARVIAVLGRRSSEPAFL